MKVAVFRTDSIEELEDSYALRLIDMGEAVAVKDPKIEITAKEEVPEPEPAEEPKPKTRNRKKTK